MQRSKTYRAAAEQFDKDELYAPLAAIKIAKASDASTVIYVETDPLVPSPDGGSWWDVPVAEVSALGTTTAARGGYEQRKSDQRPYL